MDLVFQEPPAQVHPVVWIGRYLKTVGKRLPATPRAGFWAGAGGWMLGAVAMGGFGWGLESVASRIGVWGAILEGICLWPLFSLRMLLAEAKAVDAALSESVEAGRSRLSRLVSRDVSNLSATDVREAALETLSENLTDSVVAPLLWFAVLGLPGAAIYRFANTADAMWGYRGDWEWKGKWAARADDVLNWLPARIASILVWMGSFDLRSLPAVARVTPSPNGGWTMGALALSLGVRLSKPGVYALNPQGQDVTPDDFRRGWKRVLVAAVAGALVSVVVAWNIGGA